MENFLTGEELEQKYYNNQLDLKTLSLEDLIVLSDYLGETQLSNEQFDLLEKCLEQISTFKGYEVNEQSKERIWNEILLKELEKEDNPSIAKPKIKMRKKLMISLVAVFVSILGISTVVCSANGTNVFKLFFNKDIGIVSNNENEISEMTKDVSYVNLDAFKAEHSDILYPKYIPNGYVFYEATYHLDPVHKEWNIIYTDDNGNLTRFTKTTYIPSVSTNYHYEVDGIVDEEYISNGITYHIYSNLDMLMAIWADETSMYSIDTVSSIDELKKIIDSMYE